MNNEVLLTPELNPVPESTHAVCGTRAAVATLFPGGVEWVNDVTAYCLCPGQHKHTGKNGPCDCQVKIDGVPTVYCVHASCEEEIKLANKTLRAGVPSLTPLVLTSDQKRLAAAARAKARKEEELKVRSKKALPSILKAYAWSYDRIVADGTNRIQSEDRQAMFQAFMELFENEDVVWIGDVAETGQPHHGANFKTKAQWLAAPTPAGPFTCAACFVPNSISRSKDNVTAQRYLVVESDSLKKDEVGAIFRWLDQAVDLSLRAVVDTAGKSLHGWFEFPTPDALTELKIMLPALGCDSKMFGSSQPCRLPSGLRNGRVQKLIYTKNGVSQ